MTTIYCSGLRSDARPAPGPGVARSLREGFADLAIVGVDDAPGVTGLHDAVFDELWIRSPDDGDREVLERLDAGGWWIPGTELEARRLARAGGGHGGLLSPSPEALRCFDATPGELAQRLDLPGPPTLSTREDDWRIGAFGREHGWRLWLRGPGVAPAQIDGWRTLERRRAHLAAGWSAAGLRLQAHVAGVAEAIAFAAHRGAMLGAVHLRSALETPDGETWGGEVADLDAVLPGVAGALAVALAEAGWTGGGEIDLVRSVDDELRLVDWRPRFASWVHGATLAGTNLPAALVAAAIGRVPAPAQRRAARFGRVVVEVPLRAGTTLPEPVRVADGAVRAGGYLSGMPDPARRASGAHPREATIEPAEQLRTIVGDLVSAADTPHAHAIDPGPRWRSLAAGVRAAAVAGCSVEIAYSIKTDPAAALLRAARDHGFLAEAISAAEMRSAVKAGFAGSQIVLNGPAKRWPPTDEPLPCFAAFADSLGELTSLAASEALSARYLGPRVRPPSFASRFGIELGDSGVFGGLVAALRALPASQQVGLHMHWASSEAGHATWFDTIDATLEWARVLQDASGRAIRCLDLGGGWHPDDFDTVLLPRLPDLVARCRAALDALDVFVLEPGRALAQPLCVVESSVLELRGGEGAREAVVDASLAEVPRAPVYPHRILSRCGDGWRQWGRGPDRIVGRLCMEDDVLRTGVAVPDDVRAGSRILIADAGAYDRSMAYSFGRG